TFIFLKFHLQPLSMAKDNQVQMPSSQGGLVQYFDADSGVEIDPKMVIAFTVGVVILELALHMRILA
ncbi:MAG: hypothetical protein BRC28_03425, partial [Nanohaloarchaea archaeon SW_4_43_9]